MNSQNLKYKIFIESDITLENLKEQINNGSKFIAFGYCVSILFAVTQRRFSPAFLIKENEDISKYKRKYNLITIFFGWWGFPWGPIHSIRTLHVNKSGGVDITEDIMLNIDDEALIKREVEMKLTNQLFCKPDRLDTTAFKKALLRDFKGDINIKKMAVGFFINTDSPFYTIGLQVDSNFESYIERVKKSLYTGFHKRTHFEFIDLSESTETNLLFVKQCEFIINRD